MRALAAVDQLQRVCSASEDPPATAEKGDCNFGMILILYIYIYACVYSFLVKLAVYEDYADTHVYVHIQMYLHMCVHVGLHPNVLCLSEFCKDIPNHRRG